MTRILFVLEHYYPHIGGVEQLFKGLCEFLASSNYEVEVITTKHTPEAKTYEVINGVKIRRLHLKNRFLFTFFSLPAVLKTARKVDIIHTTSYNAALPAYLVSKILTKPTIITFHEVWGQLWYSLPYLNFFERFAFSLYEKIILSLKFDRIVAVSKHTYSCLNDYGVSKSRLAHIYNGINYDSYELIKKKQNKRKLYTYFGRLGVSKGLNLLIPAAKIVSDAYPEYQLQVITPTHPKKLFKKLKGLIKKYDVQQYIFQRHHLSEEELRETVCNSEFVVIPSYSEGFCFSAVESMAMSVPLVTSNKGALDEVVGGKFVEMKEATAQSLANAIIAGIENQWKKAPINHFSSSDTYRHYRQEYDKLMGI